MKCVVSVMRLGNKEVALISLMNKSKLQIKLMNHGAAIIELLAPDREGKAENIVLAYENLEEYLVNTPYFGVTVGRTSGRINNGSFMLSGRRYQLDTNAGSNHIHGGSGGFSFRLWDYSLHEEEDRASVEFTYLSNDMENGYPGNLKAKVKYTLTDENELIIEYQASSDKDTLCNLTNHSYFNLSGNCRRKVTEQYLTIKADNFLEADSNLVPTGKLLEVIGTPMDFNSGKPVGADIESGYEPLRAAGGYDHTWLLKGKEEQVVMYDEDSGRKMTISTTCPAAVIYTYNFADNERLSCGKAGSKYDGICFETQYEPDGINHEGFNKAVLSAGESYNEKTVYKLEVL